MFNRELFTYDEETHSGFYDGKPIPSVTQLVDIIYPLDSDIPSDRLELAAERGTKIHARVEEINYIFDTNYGGNFQTTLKKAIDRALEMGMQETLDYVSILSAYKLRPFDYENLIFLCDEQGELICYGHYDLVCQHEQDVDFANFREGQLALFDVKTTSLFNKKKVALQESIYALAYEQCSKNFIANILGLWLRDGVKVIPLERLDNKFVITLCKGLAKDWYDKRENIKN